MPTEPEVDAAAEAIWNEEPTYKGLFTLIDGIPDIRNAKYYVWARAALEAAEKVRDGERNTA